jgi:hypothetical protein
MTAVCAFLPLHRDRGRAGIRRIRSAICNHRITSTLARLADGGRHTPKPPLGFWQDPFFSGTTAGAYSLAAARPPRKNENKRPGPTAKTAKIRDRPAVRRLHDWVY